MSVVANEVTRLAHLRSKLRQGKSHQFCVGLVGALAFLFGLQVLFGQAAPDFIWKTNTSASSVLAVAFSPDSATLASESSPSVRLWRATNGAPARTLTFRSDGIGSLAFSPDGGKLAAGGAASIVLWDLATGQGTYLVFDRDENFYWISLSFSSDGSLLLGGGSQGRLALWHFPEQTGWSAFEEPEPSRSVAFAPGTNIFASAGLPASSAPGRQTEVKVWPSGYQVSDPDALATFLDHSAAAYSVAFLGNGAKLASSAGDNTIIIHCLTNAAQKVVIKDSLSAYLLTGSADGKILVSASADFPAQPGETSLRFSGGSPTVRFSRAMTA